MIPLVCCIINLTQKKGGDAMNTTLTRLLLEEVYLPNRYPYYPDSLAEYSAQEIQTHEAEFEKLGLLKFWKQPAFYSISTNDTENWTPYFQPRVSVDKENCLEFLQSIK